MKRLNNKGYMLVEVIVSSMIALVIAYFLIDITVKLVNKNNDYYLESILLADKNIVTKEIMDDINSMKLTGVNCQSNTSCILTFDYNDENKKTLSINDKTISYGDYSKTFSDEVNLSQINIKSEENILTISIDAYTNYSKENYGINIVVPYNEDISIILSPEYSILVDDLEKFKTTTEVETEEEITHEYTVPGSYELNLPSGTYLLETWGAQGGEGEGSDGYGGSGGYAKGTLTLNNTTTLYVYVGGEGADASDCDNGIGYRTASGGFNGGGDGASYCSTNITTFSYCGGGGGASDIRIGTDSLYARVIVAGGGGGARDGLPGGQGGGTTGEDGKLRADDGSSISTAPNTGKGGTQTAGGASYYSSQVDSTGQYGSLSGFGNGAGLGSSNYVMAGGGGGWYGGGYGFIDTGGAGGGSGYVYTLSTSSNYPSGCLLNSSYYLTDTSFSSGVKYGDGKVSITGKTITFKEIDSYSVPQLSGLTDTTINKGTDFDLMSGVTIECETSKNGCSITGTSPSSTKNLPTGTAKIYYMVLASDGVTKYRYPRNITVVENE